MKSQRVRTRVTPADIAAITAVCTMATHVMGQISEIEPNDAFGAEQTVDGSSGSVQIDAFLDAQGNSGQPDDVDFYRITNLTPGATYCVNTEPPAGGGYGYGGGYGFTLDTVIGLFDTAGTLLGTDDQGGLGNLSSLTFTADGTGTAIIGVTGYSDFDFDGIDDFGSTFGHGEIGDYRLSVFELASQENEPNDSFANSDAVDGSFNNCFIADFNDGGDNGIPGDVDYFRFENLIPGATYRVFTDEASCSSPFGGGYGYGYGGGYGPDTTLGLFDEFGSLLTTDDDGGRNTFSSITFTADSTGTATFAVSGFSDFEFDGFDDGDTFGHGEFGTYRICIEECVGGAFFNDDDPFNDTFAGRQTIDFGFDIPISLQLADGGGFMQAGDVDYFEITGLVAGGEYEIFTDIGDDLCGGGYGYGYGGSTDTVLGVLNASGDVLNTDDDGNFNGFSFISARADETGTIYIAVSGFDDFNFDGFSDGGDSGHGNPGTYRLDMFFVDFPSFLDREPDGDVDTDDQIQFITEVDNGDPSADVDNQPGTNFFDLLFYQRFFDEQLP